MNAKTASPEKINLRLNVMREKKGEAMQQRKPIIAKTVPIQSKVLRDSIAPLL
jgi:hypothetical protein